MRRRPLFWGMPFMWGGPFMWRRRRFGSFTFLLLGGLLYKLYSDDVRRVERETRKRAEDLNEGELKEAMRRLGINRLEITPEDVDRVKRA